MQSGLVHERKTYYRFTLYMGFMQCDTSYFSLVLQSPITHSACKRYIDNMQYTNWALKTEYIIIIKLNQSLYLSELMDIISVLGGWNVIST